MPASNDQSKATVIQAKQQGTEVMLVISGDIGDDWDGENTTYNKLVNESGITDSTTFMDIGINTDGGSVNQGVAMYNFLKNHPAKIRTHILGGAHSAGSVLFLAGDERIMPSGTNALIHNPWNCSCGDHNATTKNAADLKVFTESMIDIYMERMTVTREELVTMLDNEEILSGQKALDTGFATSLVAPAQALSKEEIESRVQKARAQVSASRTCFLNKNDGVVMTVAAKEKSETQLPSIEVMQAKVDLLNTEKNQISAKHDVLATLNASLSEEVVALKEQLEASKTSDAEAKAEMEAAIEAGVQAKLADISATAKTRSIAASMGVDIKSESAVEMKREVLAAKGVKNPEAFSGESLDEMFAYVADQYSSDDADETYASVASGDSEKDASGEANMFDAVNAKMGKGA